MPKPDANGDGVFDDLARDLDRKAPDEPVGVIVTLEAPASSARVRRIERRVGSFSVRNRFRVVDAFAARVKKRQVRELAARPEVAAVESDGTVRALDASG